MRGSGRAGLSSLASCGTCTYKHKNDKSRHAPLRCDLTTRQATDHLEPMIQEDDQRITGNGFFTRREHARRGPPHKDSRRGSPQRASHRVSSQATGSTEAVVHLASIEPCSENGTTVGPEPKEDSGIMELGLDNLTIAGLLNFFPRGFHTLLQNAYRLIKRNFNFEGQ